MRKVIDKAVNMRFVVVFPRFYIRFFAFGSFFEVPPVKFSTKRIANPIFVKKKEHCEL